MKTGVGDCLGAVGRKIFSRMTLALSSRWADRDNHLFVKCIVSTVSTNSYAIKKEICRFDTTIFPLRMQKMAFRVAFDQAAAIFCSMLFVAKQICFLVWYTVLQSLKCSDACCILFHVSPCIFFCRYDYRSVKYAFHKLKNKKSTLNQS